MGKRKNHTNKLAEYLAISGLPEAEARKVYWKNYKANWRCKRRKEQKEFTISFDPKELRLIAEDAKRHHRSITRFIKEASLSYCTQQFLIPDLDTVNQIRQSLLLMYSQIQEITEDNKLIDKTGIALMEKITHLETLVLNKLTNPDKA